MNFHVLNTTASVVGRRCGTMLGYNYFNCLCNELFSYSGENTLPVNKMSQIEIQTENYYKLNI